jgi:cytoskeleton protein RodZ
MASMTPMPEPVAAAGDARQVTLKLTQASWVEFIGSDGRRLEFALLPAGTSRDYQLAGKADLRIGNVRGATLSVDGRAVDLGQFARGNIAQVTIGDEALAQ